MVGLIDPMGQLELSQANDASAGGTIIVGDAYYGDDVAGFWWNETQGCTPTYVDGNAWAVSADGNVTVGRIFTPGNRQAYRWTPTGGAELLGDLAGGIFQSAAWDVSADGSVIVGHGFSEDGAEAFRWTDDTGMVGLGELPGGEFGSEARAISANSSVIAGHSASEAGWEACLWTEDGDVVGLGDLPGGDFNSRAEAISADGTIVVGFGETNTGDSAFIWDAQHGLRGLRDVLVNDYGLDLTGWELASAHAISADGTTIVGYGINAVGYPEAFLARIPEPGTLWLLAFAALLRLRRT